jgi:hypothetical protein
LALVGSSTIPVKPWHLRWSGNKLALLLKTLAQLLLQTVSTTITIVTCCMGQLHLI